MSTGGGHRSGRGHSARALSDVEAMYELAKDILTRGVREGEELQLAHLVGGDLMTEKQKGYKMQRTKLMRELWNKSEEAEKLGDVRATKLLEIAGNLVEATFTTDSLEEVVAKAIRDGVNEFHPENADR